MKKKIGMAILMTAGLAVSGLAQEIIRSDYTEDSGYPRFKFGFQGKYGFGSERILLGRTDDGMDITIQPGGGLGAEACIGFRVVPLCEVDLGVAMHRNNCVEEGNHALTDFFSSFTDTRITFTPKITFPVFSVLRIGLGAGIDWCVSGRLDVALTDYFDNAFKYGNDIGWHVKGEIGLLVSGMRLAKESYLVLGVAYNRITYHLDGFTSDGVSVPIDQLSDEELDIAKTVNGDGLEISLGFSFYF